MIGGQFLYFHVPIDSHLHNQNVEHGQGRGLADGHKPAVDAAQDHQRQRDFPNRFPQGPPYFRESESGSKDTRPNTFPKTEDRQEDHYDQTRENAG